MLDIKIITNNPFKIKSVKFSKYTVKTKKIVIKIMQKKYNHIYPTPILYVTIGQKCTNIIRKKKKN